MNIADGRDDLSYAAEKYGAAVLALARGCGDYRQRLNEAAAASVGFPNPEHLPTEIRERIAELHELAARYPAQWNEGPYAATFARIQRSTAVTITTLICDIAAMLRHALSNR